MCPKCGKRDPGLIQCDGCGIVFESYYRQQARLKAGGSADDVSIGRISYNSWRMNFLALPLAFLFAGLCKLLQFPEMIFWYFFSIPVHEIGHAIAAWLGGRFAIPIGVVVPMAAFTTISAERSIFVYLVLVGGLGFFGRYCYQKGYRFPALVSGGFILIATYLTWVASQDFSRMIAIYGGVGGEFVLSTLLVVGFYYRLPDRVRWDFFRMFFLLVGSYVFVSVFYKWIEISRGVSALPSGSFLGGRADANGDMDRLQQIYGWTAPELVQHFNGLGKICLLMMIGHYVFFLWKAHRLR